MIGRVGKEDRKSLVLDNIVEWMFKGTGQAKLSFKKIIIILHEKLVFFLLIYH